MGEEKRKVEAVLRGSAQREIPPGMLGFLDWLFLDQGWLSVVAILACELAFAYSLPPEVLTSFPALQLVVDAVGNIAPIIGKMDTRTAAHPELVKLFLAVTILALIPKTVALYRWLCRKSGTPLGQQLIVSPLTDTKPGGVDDYILEPVRGAGGQTKRSWFSRIFWSLMIFLVTGGFWFAFLHSGSLDSKHSVSEIRNQFSLLGREGIVMWFAWSLKQMTLLSFMLAVSARTGLDYVVVVVGKLKNVNEDGAK